jgi:hypothetical protein
VGGAVAHIPDGQLVYLSIGIGSFVVAALYNMGMTRNDRVQECL